MAEETPTTINLRVLSPSAEVEGGVALPDIPTATSVKELRSRIQDAVPSRPAPERMRLIYRGRVVANENDTLSTIFGADNIRESKDQSLHLVLRELPPTASTSSSPGPRAATQPPAATSPPLQTNPFRTLPQPRPSSQPQVPPPHHPHHHPHVNHHHIPGPPNAFAIPLPPAIQQQLAQTMAAAQAEQMNNARTPSPAAANPPTTQGPPAPQVGAQAPVMGLPTLPGMGPPNDGRTVRQEGVGPNGERWSVTYSSMTIPNQAPQQPLLPRPFMHPPAFGLPPRPSGSPAPTEAIDRLLPHMRSVLQTARQEMENVQTLLHPSGQHADQPSQFSSLTPPPWRLERIRQHVQTMGQNLSLVERGLGVLAADASLTNNRDVLALRQSANELREHLEELNRMLGQQGETTASVLQPGASATTTAPITSQPTTHISPPAIPPNAPEELFLLSSPQGPVGILFDQRGTYMTAPMVPTLPFQTFTNQFAHNRQLIAGLGQHIVQSSRLRGQAAGTAPPANQFNNPLPTPTQTAANSQVQGEIPAAANGQARDQHQNQAANQEANLNPPANAQGGNDRAGNIAGHLWLVFKLACFVYFFSGTGWYKSLLLGLIAGGVYLAQIGMFEEQFNLIRRHFEAVLPVGALAEQHALPGTAELRRNMTPEEAARRLLQQHQNQRFGWVRESMRTVERSFAIFVASLWPGIGERMVHAQEERIRAERAAEEERLRLEEEERNKGEEDTRQQQSRDEDDINATEGSSDNIGTATSSAKGKEKAEAVMPEPVASGSGS
ncbi:hypothetical protein DE146DRAFT_648559 [Phaeosphaeria sp. MPI-PUGE-AT-0046c]|nr:hypothetical protein DE146DRAFT_648559 [Phaeosphaeria sp. MPI-PUGE-AT-0046c]